MERVSLAAAYIAREAIVKPPQMRKSDNFCAWNRNRSKWSTRIRLRWPLIDAILMAKVGATTNCPCFQFRLFPTPQQRKTAIFEHFFSLRRTLSSSSALSGAGWATKADTARQIELRNCERSHVASNELSLYLSRAFRVWYDRANVNFNFFVYLQFLFSHVPRTMLRSFAEQ